MAVSKINSQIGVVDSSGNVTVIYPYTSATNVEWSGKIGNTNVTNVGDALTQLNSNQKILLAKQSAMIEYLSMNSNTFELTIRCSDDIDTSDLFTKSNRLYIMLGNINLQGNGSAQRIYTLRSVPSTPVAKHWFVHSIAYASFYNYNAIQILNSYISGTNLEVYLSDEGYNGEHQVRYFILGFINSY